MIRLFRVFVPVRVFALLVSEILLTTAAFVLATYIVLQVDPTVYLLFDRGLIRILLVVLTIVLGLHFQDLYSQIRVKSWLVLVQQLSMVMGAALLTQGLVSYVDADLSAPLQVMLLGCPMAVAAIFLWRVFFTVYALRAMGRDRLLLVGDSPLLEELGEYVAAHAELGLQVAGHVRGMEDRGTGLSAGEAPGRVSFLRAIAEATKPRRVVVGVRNERSPALIDELLELRFAGCLIEEAAGAYEQILGRVCIRELRPSQLISSGDLGPRPQNVFYQTLMNTLLAAAGMVAASPLMAITALAVRFSSSGRVLSRHLRVGLNGVLFTRYKFRSMNAEADAVDGGAWAPADDARLTRAGRIIRRFRLDELPQLFNVLKGEMSLVGPHAERPEFVEAIASRLAYYRQRHYVRPGITGWAQINYQESGGPEDSVRKLEHDLYYVKNMSFSLDMLILFHTIKIIVLSRGAQ